MVASEQPWDLGRVIAMTVPADAEQAQDIGLV
jgi:hypothetical protein